MTVVRWVGLDNPFDKPGLRSYSNLNTFTFDHLNRLRNRQQQHPDPRLQQLEAELTGSYKTYVDLYVNWHSTYHQYNTQTRTLEEYLEDLAGPESRMDEWDLRIQMHHRKHSKEYRKHLMPRGRKAFTRTRRDDRIKQLEILVQKLGHYPKLEDVRMEIDAFVQEMIAVRQKQQFLEEQHRYLASELRDARDQLLEMLCYSKDMLSVIFFRRRHKVADFFFLDMLSQKSTATEEVSIELDEGGDEAATPPASEETMPSDEQPSEGEEDDAQAA